LPEIRRRGRIPRQVDYQRGDKKDDLGRLGVRGRERKNEWKGQRQYAKPGAEKNRCQSAEKRERQPFIQTPEEGAKFPKKEEGKEGKSYSFLGSCKGKGEGRGTKKRGKRGSNNSSKGERDEQSKYFGQG